MRILPVIVVLALATMPAYGEEEVPQLSESMARVIISLRLAGEMIDGVLVAQCPRSDLPLSARAGDTLLVLADASWVSWKETGKGMLMTGNFLLKDDEVQTFAAGLVKGNIRVAGIHDYSPGGGCGIRCVHFQGTGKGEVMAKTVRLALEKIGLPQKSEVSASQGKPVVLDTVQIESIMGMKGRIANGVLKFLRARKGIKLSDVELTAGMGADSCAGFAGTNEQAMVSGTLVLTEAEVNPVIRSLQNGGISVLSLHNHFLDDQPRTLFLHFQGAGNALNLARTLRAAFDLSKGQ